MFHRYREPSRGKIDQSVIPVCSAQKEADIGNHKLLSAETGLPWNKVASNTSRWPPKIATKLKNKTSTLIRHCLTYHMVIGHRVDNIELAQIVLVWDIVAVPCHYIEWTVELRATKQNKT